jgi:hypothetical protein
MIRADKINDARFELISALADCLPMDDKDGRISRLADTIDRFIQLKIYEHEDLDDEFHR